MGFVSCIGLILIEAFTNNVSNDIGPEVEPWLIYVGAGVFTLFLGGILMGLSIGFYHLRKNIRNSQKK